MNARCSDALPASTLPGDVDAHLPEKHEQWLREQYLRDLATLDRIEFQNACFFDAMGLTQGAR